MTISMNYQKKAKRKEIKPRSKVKAPPAQIFVDKKKKRDKLKCRKVKNDE